GEILIKESERSTRFADLFVGSAAVAWYVAENCHTEVLASDLQDFAVTLANAVITRNEAVDATIIWQIWNEQARDYLSTQTGYNAARKFQEENWNRARVRFTRNAREIARDSTLPITKSYGGYYFSPSRLLKLMR